jgi:photosystem II stability/assembly factor-like uncharacterized protein
MNAVRCLAALWTAVGLSIAPCQAQHWVELLEDGHTPLPQVKAAFDSAWAGRAYVRSKGWKQFQRWYWFMDQRTWPSGERPDPSTYAHAAAEVQAMRHMGAANVRSTANWEPLGPLSWNTTSYNPGNGRVNSITVDPLDEAVIYVGTPSAGLWRSLDGGDNWQPLFTDLPSMGVSGIVVDPTDPAVIYIATGDGDGADTYSAGVLKSTDAGITWNSTGLNWNLADTRTTRCLRMAAFDNQLLLCAANSGIFRTANGGTTWQQIRVGSYRDVEFQPGNDSIVYACNNTFERSTDAGAHFTLQNNNGLPAGSLVGRMAIAVTPADPMTVYVLCSKEEDSGFLGLYRSVDGGLSFSLISSTPNLFGYETDGSDPGGQSWYDMALVADPNDANTVYVGGVNVWKSMDGGMNWAIKAHWTYPSLIGYTHADIHTLEIFNGQVYCGSDGGIHASNDGAENWTDLSAGLNITQFYRFGGSEQLPYKFMAGAQDNGTNRLLNGNWTHVYGADGMEAAIDPVDPNIVYGSSQNGGILRSYNSGLNWSNIGDNISEDGPWLTPYIIDQNDPTRLLAGFHNVWITWDRGENWAMVTNWNENDFVRCIALAPSNSDVIYAARQDLMQRSDDGGFTWADIGNGLPNLTPTSFAVDPVEPLHVYVSFSGSSAGNKVYESTDGGFSWTNHSLNLPNIPVNSIVYELGTNNGLYVGTDMGVFYTNDYFSDWLPFGQGLPNVVVSELEVNLAAGKLRAATFGRGLWESDLFTSPVGITPAQGPHAPRLVPLDQAGHFALVPNAGEVFTGAQVMDALGRMVLTYHWSAGPQDIIDLSADAPGVYLVSITDGRSSWTVRVVR